MKRLLQTLNTETFILDLAADLEEMPILSGYTLRQIDAHTLEVDIQKNMGMNPLFTQLSEQGVTVLSMRNKSNRLEELFVSLVEKTLGKGVPV